MHQDNDARPYYKKNLYILSTTIFLSAVSWNQILPFLPFFLKEMGVEQNLMQWTGLVYAIQSVASIVTLPLWGKLGDKYGQKPMTIRAGLCLAAIYFGMSCSTAPWHLVLYRFLNGALTGFIPGSVALIATNTPKSAAPRAVATAQTASAAGMIVGPAIGGLLAGVAGYRGSMRISGVAVLICTLVVWLFVEEKKKRVPGEQTSLLQDFVASLRSPVMTSVMLATMLYSIFITGLNPVLALHIRNLGPGLPMWLTGVVFSLIPTAFVLSAHRWTAFGEKRGYSRGICIGTIGAAVCAVVCALAGNIWFFAAVFFLSGVFLAALNPLAGAIVCTKVDESFRGRAYGMLWSAGTFGALLAPLSAAGVAAAFGIPAVFAAIGAVFVLGLLLFRHLVRKWGKPAMSDE